MGIRSTPLSGIRRLLRLPASRRSIEAEIDDEIRFHLESRVEELSRRGLSPAVARETAEREYGNLDASRRELAAVNRRRHARRDRMEHVAAFWQDLRYAARGLARRPALATVTTLTLTLGIGANAVMFGVVDQLLVRPPAHVANAAELRQIYVRERADGGKDEYTEVTSYAIVRALREQVPLFADVVAAGRGLYILGRGAEAAPIDVSLVDGSYFSTLGVQPAAGRFFAPAETRVPQGADVAVISARFRQRRFDATTDPLGQRLIIEGRSFTIVGVAPPGFSGIDRVTNIDAWVPFGALAAAKRGTDWYRSNGSDWVHAIARLRPGVAPTHAANEATRVLRILLRESPDRGRDTLATAILGSINGVIEPGGLSAEARTSLWLMGVSVMVLLIAVANVANLLVARAVQRRREIAVRLALGVSRGRLFRQLLTESLLLATIAGAVALVASSWAGRAVEQLLLPGFVWSDGVVDLRVLGFTIVVMFVACALAGVAPVVYGLRTDVNHALKAGAREWTGSRSTLRRALLIAQAALSVVLLVGSGLFVRSLSRVRAVDVGIDLDRVLLVAADLGWAGFDSVRQRTLYTDALERIRRIPGVAGATAIAGSTPTRIGLSMKATVPGGDRTREPENGGPYYSVIDDSFLPVIGSRLRRGRGFLPAELRVPSRVAIVNETTADFYWPGENPIGNCLLLGQDAVCTEIVGVIQPIFLFKLVNEPSYAQLFVPPTHPVAGNRGRTLMVRVAGDPGATASQVRAVLQGLAPDMPYVSVRSMADIVAPQVRPWRLGATMFTLFGVVALAIAAIGLYCVMAYWVSQRSYEFGVRMALGARPRDVRWLVAGEAAGTLGIGLAIGVLIALLAAPRASALLFRTSPYDATVYLIVAGLLGLAALAATIIPARRSTQADPVTALRAE